MKLYKFFTAIGVIALAAGFTSCSDDDEVYTDGFEGIEGQVVLAPTYNESYKFIKIPTGVIAPEITWSVSPRSRVRAAEDLTMKFEIDNSLIEAYNLENNTGYVALPAGVVTMDVSEATITPGNTSAEIPVSLKVTDDAALLGRLEVGEEYLVPVRMTAVTQGSARIAVSADNTSYITFTVNELMINPSGTPTGQTVDDKSAWNIWYDGDAFMQSGGPTSCINGGQTWIRGWDFYTYLDLGKEYTFDGIYASCPYGTYYCVFRAGTSIQISSDNSTWRDLGTTESNLGYTLTLYAPVTARYIRFAITAVYSGGHDFMCNGIDIYAL